MKTEGIIGLYEKVRSPYSFLLQSGMNGKWSFIGYKPEYIFLYRHKTLEIRNLENSETRKLKCPSRDQVLEELKKMWKRCGKDVCLKTGRIGASVCPACPTGVLLPFARRASAGKQPASLAACPADRAGWCAPTTDMGKNKDFPPFTGGLVGFFSYDFGVKFEEIKQSVKDDVGYPEVCFGVYDKVIAVDCEKEVLWEFGNSLIEAADLPLLRIESSRRGASPAFALRTSAGKQPARPAGGCTTMMDKRKTLKIKSNLTLPEYISSIKKIKSYLKSGDTYQVNFSQRFMTDTSLDPFEIYKKVTKINPSPFQAYFQGEDFAIVSNSPERLVRVRTKNDKKIIDTRPIKGTMPRGKTKAQDEKYRKILLDSKKDKAELTMIVDLARNDIGKICKMGTVEVNEDRITEGYSHVWHTMSNVVGEMRKDKNFVDVIKAVFPGGSITGCPKKRTMEIIDELEEFKRGVYTGSLGYISWNGDLDFNIMIRTMFCKRKAKNWRIYFHSGGGIVMDSDARLEYEETLDKAKALIKSLS